MFLVGRLHGSWLRAAAAMAIALAGGLVLPLPAAQAARRPTVEQVRKQIDDLDHQAEAATERYNGLKEQIVSLNVRLAATKTKLDEQRKAVAVARESLGQVAADTYKAGDLATLALFLSDQPDRFVAAEGLLLSLGDRRGQAMQDLLHQQQQLVSVMTDVQEQQQRLEKARKDLQSSSTQVEHKLSQAKALLARLTGEERSRLGRIRAGGERTALTGLGIKVPSSGRLTCDDVPVQTPSARVAKVIAYACAQLGDPYRWAGDGPNEFDCSGLSMMAWKQAGVSLPHNSQLQAKYGTKVSSDALRPGDLVFFYSSLSHMGIYLGKGLMIHAPRTGDVVKIAPMRYNSSFATAVRL